MTLELSQRLTTEPWKSAHKGKSLSRRGRYFVSREKQGPAYVQIMARCQNDVVGGSDNARLMVWLMDV